eukprot:NODE_679_length_4801_cov_0.851978.p2 type:complete len:275 gc:universal NODE_679_length_4801_cov_0.851978:2909-3733(+)
MSDSMNCSISSLHLQKPHLISVQPTSSIANVLQILKDKNITSIPIQSHSDKLKFMGIISAFDICVYLLRNPQAFTHHIESALSLDSNDESFRLNQVDGYETLKSVMQELTKSHRLLVHDQFYYLISQSDIIRHLYTSEVNLNLQSKNLRDLSPNRSIKSLSSKMTAKEAFQQLKISNHLALPIIDQNNEFVHVLSSSDTRGLSQNSMTLLELNILEYLREIKKMKPTTAKLEDSLKYVMKCSVDNLAHRTFILEDNKVINVVSLTDIIKLFLNK